MAMYFDFPLRGAEGLTPGLFRWSPVYPYLAVAGTQSRQGNASGCVQVFNEEGELCEGASLQRVSRASALAWQPSLPVLAVGWENGEMLSWNHSTKQAHECKQLHMAPIRFLEFSRNGSHLISGDNDGQVGIWKLGAQGKLGLIQAFKLDLPLLVCATLPGDDSGMSDLTREEFQTRSTIGSLGSAAALLGTPLVFYVGARSGEVFKCDQSGNAEQVFVAPGPLAAMVLDAESLTFVAITEALAMVQFRALSNGDLVDRRDVKLPGRKLHQAVWAGPGVLAAATTESSLRVFDLARDDNYALTAADGAAAATGAIRAVQYDAQAGLLVACSDSGRVLLWRAKSGAAELEGAERWSAQPPLTIGSGKGTTLQAIDCGAGSGLVAVASDTTVSIVKKHHMVRSFGANLAAVQVSAVKVVADLLGKGTCEFEVEGPIKGVSAYGQNVAVWSGKQIHIFEVIADGSRARVVGSFPSTSLLVCLHDTQVFVAEGSKIIARNFQGSSQQTLVGDEAAPVTHLNVNGHFLVASTTGNLRSWDVSRREVRTQGGHTFQGEEGEIIADCCINCDGTRISFVTSTEGTRNTHLRVVDLEGRQTLDHDFRPSGRVPMAHFWDTKEPKLLACETRSIDPSSDNNNVHGGVTTLFATPYDGLKVHDRVPSAPQNGALFGLSVPHLLFVRRPEHGTVATVYRGTHLQPLRDFSGLQNSTPATLDALLNFSYYLTIGNMDDAFNAVSHIE